jgi:hypothetical protein
MVLLGYRKNLNDNNNNNKWKVVFDCGHTAIMSDKELHNPIEQQLNPITGIRDNVYVCEGCASEKNGFCHNTVLHRIQHAEPLNSLDRHRSIWG